MSVNTATQTPPAPTSETLQLVSYYSEITEIKRPIFNFYYI